MVRNSKHRGMETSKPNCVLLWSETPTTGAWKHQNLTVCYYGPKLQPQGHVNIKT